MSFRADIAWGAATAAYQIEGGHDAGGRGASVWDEFCRWPGKVRGGETGDVACDHYHRLEEDLDLMADLGLKAYRFSFSWSRVLSRGTGTVNEAGLAFYDRLVDGLLERGIQPWATLFHWCYPLELQQRGGWSHPESPRWFAEYAGVMARHFRGRIAHWITLNEPQMFVGLGHATGVHAPGLVLPSREIARIMHHVLLAHGLAVDALRRAGAGSVGWAPAMSPSAVEAASESDAEVVADARAGQFGTGQVGTQPANCLAAWCDPVFLGRYPEAFAAHYGAVLPEGWESDLAAVAVPLDFCGLNIYFCGARHGRRADGRPGHTLESAYGPGFPRTRFNWPVTPEALYWGPRWMAERYGVPIVITENGMSGTDWPARDGGVHDPQRIDFTARYLAELRRAAAEGVDIGGYFHWSLLDNFEWAEGYRERFGLVHVDFETQRRTPKDSARWYRDVIASNGVNL